MRIIWFWDDEEDFCVIEIKKVVVLLSGTFRMRDLVFLAIAILFD